jgi:FkbM family methyltransferase
MTLRRVFLSAIGLLMLANLIFYSPMMKLCALTWTGRSACTVRQTIDGSRYMLERTKLREAFKRESRIVEQGPDGLHLWETPRGRFWMPARSDGYITLELAEQENHLYGSGEWAVHAGDTVLDCGANLGAFTYTALRAGAKLVIAIEPAPDNVECLRRTYVKEITEGRVIVYPKGVWNKDDVLVLNDGGSSLDDSFVFHATVDKAGVRVPLTTIDKMAAELKLTRVDFIKMDIEGAERQALDGARQTISAFKPRMAIATEHLPDDPENIPLVVSGLWPGYQMRCGPCYAINGRIAPDVQYYR